MPLNPEVAELLARDTDPVIVHQLSPQEARVRYALRASRRPTAAPPQLAGVVDRSIEGEHELPLRIYTPLTQSTAPLPLVLFFHGGGFVVGSLDTHDTFCRHFAQGLGCILVAVDYRLAPEHPFPAATEDAWRALHWLHVHASELGGDGTRIALAGDSAGGNLAAVTALRARSDLGPPLRAQILIYPMTDHGDHPTASQLEFANGFGLSLESLRWFWKQYLAPGQDYRHPQISPLCASDLHGLPPTLIVTAECDVLRDEAEAYAARLDDAGVAVTLRRYPGMIHGFMGMLGMISPVAAAVDETCSWIRAHVV